MGKENKFDDLVSYKIETISRPQQITPDVIGSFYTYYKPSKSTNVLIDVTMYMTNLQKKEIKTMSLVGEHLLLIKLIMSAQQQW